MSRPSHLKRLQIEMVKKDLSLRDLVEETERRGAKIPYTYASELLSGGRVHTGRLSLLTLIIEEAPMPREGAKV